MKGLVCSAHEVRRKQESETWMLDRMRKGPFKFIDLWAHFGAQSPEYREADRLIQRERKAGRIQQIKRGVWLSVVPQDSKESE